VLTVESGFQGERFTARGGFFVKRERPFRLQNIVLRGSTEVESDLTGSLRYAVGLGLDYTKTGLTTVLQSSRTNFMHNSGWAPETRTGLFLAGTVESPEQYYVEAMRVSARFLQEAWQDFGASQAELHLAEAEMRVLSSGNVTGYRMARLFESIRKANADSESYRARMATMAGDYFEARRTAYSLKQWKRGTDDFYGPVDGEVLENVASAVVQRLGELVEFLHGEVPPLQALRDKYVAVQEQAYRLGRNEGAERTRIASELAEIDRALRQESEAVSQALSLYYHYLGAVRRIGSLDAGFIPARQLELLNQRMVRRLLTLVAQPLQ
jgi:hypothetical protein